MEINWLGIGIVGFCAAILVIYLVIKNLKDKKDVTNSFIDKVKNEKKFELDDTGEY